jgi:hypothetical protein
MIRGTSNRRSALKQIGGVLTAMFVSPFVRAFGQRRDAGLFAGQFVQSGATTQVPLGRYDPKTQTYVSVTTNKAMFSAEATGAEPKRLSEAELERLLKGGRFVDLMQLEKAAAFGGWCSLSRLTTLSTTGPCCPIITDTSSDTQCDDTGPNPPPK